VRIAVVRAKWGSGAETSTSGSETSDMLRVVRQEEFKSIRGKYILPFACEQKPVGIDPGGVKPWSMVGPLELHVPRSHVPDISRPISIERGDVQAIVTRWVTKCMPLQFLTTRSDESIFSEVRSFLCEPIVSHLAGLLAHLLYWLALSPSCLPEEQQLPPETLQAMVASALNIWWKLEKQHRSTSLGVSFTLPCLLLTLKRGIELCFEKQYPAVMAEGDLRHGLVERINTLLMRLCDTENKYARFGKLDCTGRAASLSRRLDAVRASIKVDQSTRKRGGSRKVGSVQ